jgi:hypothetical protein
LVVIVNFVFNSLYIHNGGGRHDIYLTPKETLAAIKFSNLAMFPFVFCTCITKLSIAFMVLRLTNKNWMKYYMYALMLSLVLLNGGCLVVLFAYCRPTRAFWDVTVMPKKCWSPTVLQTASNIQGGMFRPKKARSFISSCKRNSRTDCPVLAWSIVTDIILTTIPIVMVWQLQMASKQKIVVTTLVGFGLM